MKQEHKDNLLKLADYLDVLPKDYAHFSMILFNGYIDEDGDAVDVAFDDRPAVLLGCGTAACAVGHGPYAGIEVEKEDYSWHMYCKRVFGINSFDAAFDDVFGPEHSDDPKEAAARIRHYVKQESK